MPGGSDGAAAAIEDFMQEDNGEKMMTITPDAFAVGLQGLLARCFEVVLLFLQ